MPQLGLNVTHLGKIAHQVLAQDRGGNVLGTTSRGVFLRLQSGWVIYLSSESFKGPLSLNLPGHPGFGQTLEPGIPVEIETGDLNFTSTGFTISTSDAILWEAPPRPNLALPLAQRNAHLRSVSQVILTQGGGRGMSWLLSNLLDLPGFQADSNSSDSLIFDLTQLCQALNAGCVARILSALEPFLGKGSGLTPSGDDLVMGLLLSLNRWGDLLRPHLEVQELNQPSLQLAYRRTSTLAANLIECATLGQANERLLFTLDGILTGDPNPATCAANLLDWGNTSGADALVGMALAILFE